MKSIYYNWKKPHDTQKNPMSDEEAWGQFVDLEINDYYNNKHKLNKHTRHIHAHSPSFSHSTHEECSGHLKRSPGIHHGMPWTEKL